MQSCTPERRRVRWCRHRTSDRQRSTLGHSEHQCYEAEPPRAPAEVVAPGSRCGIAGGEQESHAFHDRRREAGLGGENKMKATSGELRVHPELIVLLYVLAAGANSDVWPHIGRFSKKMPDSPGAAHEQQVAVLQA